MQFAQLIVVFMPILMESSLAKDTQPGEQMQETSDYSSLDQDTEETSPPLAGRPRRQSFPPYPFHSGTFLPFNFPPFPNQDPRTPVLPQLLPGSPWHHHHVPRHHSGFPSFFTIPDLKVRVPSPNEDTFYDIQVMNGIRVETNRTVKEGRDSRGRFVEEVQVVRYYSEEEDGRPGFAGDPSSGDGTTTTPYVGFGIQPVSLKRNRRWVASDFLQKFFLTLKNKISSRDPPSQQPPSTPESSFRSLEGDTRVNYINNRNSIEADAEVFDPERFRADRRESLAENFKTEISISADHATSGRFSNQLDDNASEGISKASYVHSTPEWLSNKHRRPSIENEEREHIENSLVGNEINNYRRFGSTTRLAAIRYEPRRHHKLLARRK